MSIGKRTLTQGISSPHANRVCPFAAVQMRIDHATQLVGEARDEHLPALRDGVARRSLDAAYGSSVALRRALAEIEREVREARRLTAVLEDEISTQRAARLGAELEALAEIAAPWLAVAPPPPALPPETACFIAHVPGDAAVFRAEQAEGERAWQAQIDGVHERRARATAGIVDVAEWRQRRDREPHQ